MVFPTPTKSTAVPKQEHSSVKSSDKENILPKEEEELPGGKRKLDQNYRGDDESNNDARGRKRERLSSRSTDKMNTPIRQINPAGRVAEAGVVKKIYVENFMCHRKLTVELCRNVNFIHGQNGSGKSAILAAIQICLGAGAKRTHRARNLRELVRKEAGSDCSGAKVRVTLWNKGSDSFQHDTYGDEITVERSISLRAGYNGYKLIGSDGKEHSRSKKDLDMLLDQLNIQVENPVAILDQEEAKKFLCGKPEDKYAFFAKATELERMDRSYASVADNIIELDETNTRIKGTLRKAAENVKMLKREWEEFQKIDKLEDKLSGLRVKYAWACYNDFLQKAEEEKMNLNEIEKKLKKRKEELDKVLEACNVNEDEETKLKEKLQILTTEAEEAAETKSTLEADQKRAIAPLKKLERELSSNKREIQQARRRLKTAQKNLQEARDEIIKRAGSAQSEEAKRTERLNKAEQDLMRAKDSHDQQKEALNVALQKYEELEPAHDQAKSNCENIKSQHHAIKKKLSDLTSSKENSLAIFGQKCSRMHEQVNAALSANRFRGKVIGPIGFYIKVAKGKEQYAKIAELTLGRGTLDRFIVTNDADRALFMKLRKQVGCNTRECGVFQTHSGQRYNVPPPPTEGIETVASVLSIDDDLIYNCLVDHLRMDQLALSNSKEESERALLIRENGRDRVRGNNIKMVYFLPNGDYWQVQRGNLMMISNEKPLRQTIGVDRSEAIKEAQNELDHVSNEMSEICSKEAEINMERKNYKLRWNEANRNHRNTTILIEKLQNTIEDIKAEADAAENVTIDTSELEDDVNQAMEISEKLSEKESQIRSSMEQMHPRINEVKQKLEEITSRNNKVLADICTCQNQLEEYMRNHAQKQALVEKRQLKVTQAEEAKSSQIDIVRQRTETKDEAFLKARLVTHHSLISRREKSHSKTNENEQNSSQDNHLDQSPPSSTIDIESIEPIETDKPSNYYKRRLENTLKEIEDEKRKKNLSEKDPEVALQKFQRAKNDLDSKYHQIETVQNNIDAMIVDMRQRRRRWKQFRSHIADMTNETFDEMLNKKNSSGEIAFDHSEKTLNLTVQKDNTDRNMSQTRDVKALSGGERSFVTLSLLLALGENLETPFRVMDEFDVFLDPMSRKIALETMIKVAKGLAHRQFIFITPQDLSNLRTDPMLKIFAMKNPDRNLQGPAQQTLEYET